VAHELLNLGAARLESEEDGCLKAHLWPGLSDQKLRRKDSLLKREWCSGPHRRTQSQSAREDSPTQQVRCTQTCTANPWMHFQGAKEHNSGVCV